MSDLMHVPKAGAIQGFCPSEIQAGITVLDTSSIFAIRIHDEAEYFINADSANKAIMPPSVTVIPEKVTSMTFSIARAVEVMR